VVLRGKQDFLFDLLVSGPAGVEEVVHDDLVELRLVSAEELGDLLRELGRQVVQELEFGQRALQGFEVELLRVFVEDEQGGVDGFADDRDELDVVQGAVVRPLLRLQQEDGLRVQKLRLVVVDVAEEQVHVDVPVQRSGLKPLFERPRLRLQLLKLPYF